MGHRTVKRVPLDFDAPMNEVWEGYVSPEWRRCTNPDCENGSTTAGRWMQCFTDLILLAGSESASSRPLHPWLQAVPLAPNRRPGPDMAALTEGLAGRSGTSRLGHDAIDGWSATKKITEAAGMPDGWGICQACKGRAIHPDDQEASETWTETEPPTGAGWQLWETTSEGSPVSPVFDTPEGLAEWCAGNATIFGSERMPYERWLSLILDDDVDFGSLLVATDGYSGSAAQMSPREP